MKKITCEVTNPYGLDLRSVAALVKACHGLNAKITLRCGEKTAPGNNVMLLSSLRAKAGDVLEIAAEGGDEEAALGAVRQVLHEINQGGKEA